MNAPPKELFEISHAIAAHGFRWTQGGGGNVSVKSGDTLFIKASGFRLDGMNETAGWARVDRPTFEREYRTLAPESDDDAPYSAAITAAAQAAGSPARPSMETGFHALLADPWVLHFHALSALLMAHVAATRPEEWDDWLSRHSHLAVAVIGATMPGLPLTRAILNQAEAQVFLLDRHGVILQGRHSASALKEFEKFEADFLKIFGFEKLRTLSPRDLVHGPLKLYFPDSAVFVDRLMKVTVTEGPLRVLAHGAEAVDLDASELWWATQALQRTCPALTELPEDISSRIAGLSTEQFRRNLKR